MAALTMCQNKKCPVASLAWLIPARSLTIILYSYMMLKPFNWFQKRSRLEDRTTFIASAIDVMVIIIIMIITITMIKNQQNKTKTNKKQKNKTKQNKKKTFMMKLREYCFVIIQIETIILYSNLSRTGSKCAEEASM